MRLEEFIQYRADLLLAFLFRLLVESLSALDVLYQISGVLVPVFEVCLVCGVSDSATDEVLIDSSV